MSLETALRELGKEIQKDPRYEAHKNASRRQAKVTMLIKTELKNFSRIIRNSMRKSCRMKIWLITQNVLLKWSRWLSISAR